MGDPNVLLLVRFSAGTVTYTDSYQVFVDGALWPRELDAANKMLDIHKEQSKENARRSADAK